MGPFLMALVNLLLTRLASGNTPLLDLLFALLKKKIPALADTHGDVFDTLKQAVEDAVKSGGKSEAEVIAELLKVLVPSVK